MRYIVREKVFTIGNKFQIKDDQGIPRFEVVGKVFTIGKKLNIYDMIGNNVAYIEQKIFRFLPEYNIYLNNQLGATIKQKLSFFKHRFSIESDFGDFDVEGDIFAYNFSIYKNGREVARVNKKWISFSDTYMVDIDNNENQAFILSIVIVLDQVLHDYTPQNNTQ